MTNANVITIPGQGIFTPWDRRGELAAAQTLMLLESQGREAFTRNPDPGHITGSGFIVSPDRKQTLLLHHRKLDLWLAPGGHCDGEPDARTTALREIEEETGLTKFSLVRNDIFDIDVHIIPARLDVPQHMHFDIRYLVVADPSAPVPGNDESFAQTWVSMQNLEQYTRDPAVLVVRNAESW